MIAEPPSPVDVASPPMLGVRNWERVEGWGMSSHCFSNLFAPQAAGEIEKIIELARREGASIACRGAGRSYGDAALNDGGIVLDLQRMNRILDWNPSTGLARLEPGVTIKQLWQRAIRDCYWPAVVPGTMFPTMGGCAAMNIHGKNNFKAGTFGDQIREFTILLPSGEYRRCSREENADLFHAAIGGFGMLGVFTEIVLKLKKVHSGYLWVEAIPTETIQEMIDIFEERLDHSDYLVGWIDCFANGKGLIHQAGYLPEGQDPHPEESTALGQQELPPNIMGLMPKAWVWMFMQPFCNNLGMRMINLGKRMSSKILQPPGHRHFDSHARFAFLLDYVPNWKWAYKPGGLIQYQSFIPKENAARCFDEILRRSKRAGLPPYLGVFKKHRPDPFLLTHALDGYSLALDFRVTSSNRSRLWKLAAELDRVVLAHGGKFYFAKDSTLRPEIIARFLPKENLEKFARLKAECDPENLLQTNLSRRLFRFGES